MNIYIRSGESELRIDYNLTEPAKPTTVHSLREHIQSLVNEVKLMEQARVQTASNQTNSGQHNPEIFRTGDVEIRPLVDSSPQAQPSSNGPPDGD